MKSIPLYRSGLPQLDGDLFLVDGGIETFLIYHEGIALPHFAAFDLLKTEAYLEVIEGYFQPFYEIAKKAESGFILESLTWRASRDWGEKLGYSKQALAEANRLAVDVNAERRRRWEGLGKPIVLSGCIGPRRDAYDAENGMSIDQSRLYHEAQIETLATTETDVITAATLNNPEEGVGIVQAAQECDIPVILSFTLESNGGLPNGQSLSAAIRSVDDATDGYVSYYGINCAHPTHFEHLFSSGDSCLNRVRAVRVCLKNQKTPAIRPIC